MTLEKIIQNSLNGGAILISCGTTMLTFALPSLAVDLKADYQFQNTLSSSVAGAPNLVDLGSSNTFGTAIVDGQSVTVFNFAQQTGLQLSTAGLIPNNQYTVVALFEFDQAGGYRKILDFKDGTSDTGLYNLNSNLNFYNVTTGSGNPIPANTYVQVALTRDASNQVTGYVDGLQQFSFDDSGNLGTISTANLLKFFRDDNATGGGESSAGSVARIRLYDDVLSPTAIAALDRLPSVSSSVPEPSTIIGLGALGFCYLLKRKPAKAK